jgi:hypothetical protein
MLNARRKQSSAEIRHQQDSANDARGGSGEGDQIRPAHPAVHAFDAAPDEPRCNLRFLQVRQRCEMAFTDNPFVTIKFAFDPVLRREAL